MERDAYLAHLARDGQRMADLARGDLTAPVPTCPGWMLRDLVQHTGQVHRWQTEACRVDAGTFPDVTNLDTLPVDGETIADWFQRGVDSAVATMGAVDADEARWTWSRPDGGDTAQWYFQRIAQETLVHRIDAELAAGDVTDVEPAFAADGVDEFCDLFLPMSQGIDGVVDKTLHLHATDTEGEWLLAMHADHVEATRGHAKGDAAIRAGARDLLLLAWGRDPIGEIELFGDEELVRRFRAAPRA